MMRVLIVDDEPSARQYLRDLLESMDAIEVIGEARDGLQAVSLNNKLRPDLLLLDIQMPVMDGLSLIPYLTHRPIIVFITAYDQYAIDAFDLAAIDYLLKPVEPQRLRRSLDRASQTWEQISALHHRHLMDRQLTHIVCKTVQQHLLVDVREIQLITKQGRYAAIQVSDSCCHLSELSLDYLELHGGNIWFRINRRTLLPLNQIASFESNRGGTGSVTTRSGAVMSISRARMADFKSWIQTHTKQ